MQYVTKYIQLRYSSWDIFSNVYSDVENWVHHHVENINGQSLEQCLPEETKRYRWTVMIGTVKLKEK